MGTAAATTRGMNVDDMKIIGEIITNVVKYSDDSAIMEKSAQMALDLCKKYPLYAKGE